jgi:hypothetical protein
MSFKQDEVFGVIRCKTATKARGSGDVAGLADADTACEGAQAALTPKTATGDLIM